MDEIGWKHTESANALVELIKAHWPREAVIRPGLAGESVDVTEGGGWDEDSASGTRGDEWWMSLDLCMKPSLPSEAGSIITWENTSIALILHCPKWITEELRMWLFCYKFCFFFYRGSRSTWWFMSAIMFFFPFPSLNICLIKLVMFVWDYSRNILLVILHLFV